MKLFYTRKQYGVLVDKIEKLQGVYDELKKKYDNKEFKYLEGYSKYKDISEKLEIEKGLLLKENDDLKAKIKEQKKQIKELEKQLEESMSDKYLVRKVRGTKPTKQTTKIKSSVKQSNAIKLVKEKL